MEHSFISFEYICCVVLSVCIITGLSAPVHGKADGRSKFIVMANDGVTPVKIHTQRGSFIGDGLLQPNTALIFSRDHWKDLTGKRPNWFTETQQGDKLSGTGVSGDAQQGISVALSADGNTLAEGGSDDNANDGAVWIFTRSNGEWSQQGPKLVGLGSDKSGGSVSQGSSIAFSGDGNTLAESGIFDASNEGAVWIFTRSNGVWSQQGPKLVGLGSDKSGGSVLQGNAIALSADGNTLAEGGSADASLAGAVWIFTRLNGAWTQQGPKLVGSGAVGIARQGFGVALSADGNTLASGAAADDTNVGAVWIFTRSGGEWFQQGSKLTASDQVGAASFGVTVALSADGNTLAVGGSNDNGSRGAVWIFTRTGGVWTQQGNKLVGTYASSNAIQGRALTISADGNTMAEGGHQDNGSRGAVWVFVCRAGLWVQMGNKLVGTGASGTTSHQGVGVALSADANTLVEGGYSDGGGIGAVWVFV